MVLHIDQPAVNLEYHVANGKTDGAELVLSGAGGLTWRFDAGTDTGMRANVNEDVQPNFDLSIPIGGPVPLAITVRQHFIVKTAFGVANTTVAAVGDYQLNGTFRVGLVGGKFSLGGPMLSTRTNMLDTLGGLSLGHSGLVLSHQLKIVAGLGAFGFAAGPYFGLNSSLGVSRSSDITAPCKSATLGIAVVGGVGYLIPKPVTTALNFFLRALKLPEIRGEGGLAIGDPLTIVNNTTSVPPNKMCTVDRGGAR